MSLSKIKKTYREDKLRRLLGQRDPAGDNARHDGVTGGRHESLRRDLVECLLEADPRAVVPG